MTDPTPHRPPPDGGFAPLGRGTRWFIIGFAVVEAVMIAWFLFSRGRA